MEHAAVEILVLLLVGSIVGMIARRLRVPYTLALVLAGVALSFVELDVLHAFQLSADVLFTFLLPALLFEAAFHLDLSDLRRNALPIGLLAVPGVLVATAVVGGLLGWSLGAFRADFPWANAFLFAAVIAATDPISVLALFRELGVTRRLYLLVEGESLLNDGVAVVVFLIVAAVAGIEVGHLTHVELHGASEILVYGLRTFVWMAGGGIFIGVVFGAVATTLMRQIDEHLFEITLTTVVAFGSFLVSEQLGCSGVLSTVAAGIVTGSFGARYGMSTRTRLAVEDFWSYAAFVANTLVFLLVGLELHITTFASDLLPIALAFVVTLIGRTVAVSVTVPWTWLRWDGVPLKWTPVLIWGGLRGSLSMVLVLGLPATMPGRELLVHLVFGTVSASLFLQGLTAGPLLAWLGLSRQDDPHRHTLQVDRARLIGVRRARHELEELAEEGLIAGAAAERLEAWYDRRANEVHLRLGALLGTAHEVADEVILDAALRLMDVEREAIRHAAHADAFSVDAAGEALADIDDRVAALREATHHDEISQGVREVLGEEPPDREPDDR